MSTRFVLRLVVANETPAERKRALKTVLGREVRLMITKLIAEKKIEIGEVMVVGEFMTEEHFETRQQVRRAKGHAKKAKEVLKETFDTSHLDTFEPAQ